jgi:uncharacterized protein YukE
MSTIAVTKEELDKMEALIQEQEQHIKSLKGIIRDQQRAVEAAKGAVLANSIQLRRIEIQYSEFLALINRKVGRAGAADTIMEKLKTSLTDLERSWQKFREESPDAAKMITGLTEG